jgi:ATP synthase protein I
VLGGLISVCAGAAFAALGSLAEGKPAGFALVTMLRAESVKIGLMVVLLWIVLAAYAKAVVLALIASFLVTALIFSMAALVREE